MSHEDITLCQTLAHKSSESKAKFPNGTIKYIWLCHCTLFGIASSLSIVL